MENDPTGRKAGVKRQFNSAAANYDVGAGVFAHFGQRLVAVAEIAPGHRVLDVASGRGAVLFPADEKAGASGHATGVDLAEEMVQATNEEAARRGLRARVQVMDAEHLAFPDASFDRVLCGFGIMFFPDQPRALAEFRRVLKPGGRLAVSTWRSHQANEIEAALIGLGMMVPRLSGWITEPEALAQLLTAAGFGQAQAKPDSQSFRYADAEDYWLQARGTGMRRTMDALDPAQTERLRSALAERMEPYRRPDGFHLAATALFGAAVR